MDSASSGSLIAVITIARAAGLLVLATEALFLWSRRREHASAPQAPTLARFFWAATPAAILAGLALWCMTSVAPAQKPAAALALHGSTTSAN